MKAQERLNRQGQQYIAALRIAVKAAWDKACEHDKIDPKASFVVFSKTNPYEAFYQKAMAEYLEAGRQYAAGGYVGLQIVNGRAQ
jgi:hypothetical protein